MAEAAVVDAQETSTASTESLGWRAGLPDDLKQNAEIANYKTVGDFTKDAISWKGKIGELEGKLADSIPKLPDDATDEDRAIYLDALGRPPKASEYEFDGEDKNAPEWTNLWKQQFHELGLTKAQAKQLSAKWNTQMQQMVEAHNSALKAESDAAEQRLRTEMGTKYDTNVELAKRLWQKHGEGEFDKAFDNAPGAVRFGVIRALLKFAALTGEDSSPQGSQQRTKTADAAGFDYSKSPAPPKKS